MLDEIFTQTKPSDVTFFVALALLWWRMRRQEGDTATHESRISRLEGIDEAGSR